MAPRTSPFTTMHIRPATETDFDQMWRIFQSVVCTGDSYVFAADTSFADAHEYFLGPGITAFVADVDGRIVGFYKLMPNRRDRGSHVANASYMVDPTDHRKGVGRQLGWHSLREARVRGFHAMQFNFVVSTNARAVALWQSLGFAIVGTSPKAFRHAALGDVDAYAMHRSLEDLPPDDSNDVPTFGARVEGYPYVVRPSAYALIMDDTGQLAVVRTREGMFLPGGGIDPPESAEQAAVRETREECAIEIDGLSPVGRAVDIVLSTKDATCFEKRSAFFAARVAGTCAQEPEHEVLWLNPEAAIAQMRDHGHAWAISALLRKA